MNWRRSAVRAIDRGACGQSNSGPAKVVRPRRTPIRRRGIACAGAELGPPFLQERRTERHVLGPADRLVDTARVLHRFADPNGRPLQLDPALDLRPARGRLRAHDDRIAGAADVEVRDRYLAVHRQPAASLGVGRPAKDVEAEVVAHDPGEQARFDAATVFGVAQRVVGSRVRSRARAASTADSHPSVCP